MGRWKRLFVTKILKFEKALKKIGKIIDNLYKSIKFADRSSNEI